ncbi:M23 family metallopeptidase [Porphyrobacter sp. AAP60]|uniref:M23 family metallopeptidase n=1 Tax=Porphyrobacter sp. AAP60 TaxID=1523423 RepID=UPI0006B9DC54|nr:M23 family metallopeptidase [Porphyrobacter sp. AAP60]KPF63867.1 peptidase [Porphyrobacter sp. AAP60]
MLSLRALGVLGAIALFGCAANDPAPSNAAGQDDPFYGQNTRFSWRGALTQGGFINGLAPDGTVRVTMGDTQLELSPDGTFFAAFDRDSPSTVLLTAQLDSGQVHRETLTIVPRAWQIERVDAAKRGGRTSEAFWKIREPEWNAINAARAQVTGATGWQQNFIWPVKGRISGRFGRQRVFRGEPADYHSGIDIAPGAGVPFVAPADGVVVLARTGFSLEGSLIIIDHGNGLNSAFLHASRIVVREGEPVTQGQHIGNVGATGRATGPHLHWSLKWRHARLDPILFTGPMD